MNIIISFCKPVTFFIAINIFRIFLGVNNLKILCCLKYDKYYASKKSTLNTNNDFFSHFVFRFDKKGKFYEVSSILLVNFLLRKLIINIISQQKFYNFRLILLKVLRTSLRKTNYFTFSAEINIQSQYIFIDKCSPIN